VVFHAAARKHAVDGRKPVAGHSDQYWRN
jgi:hypothetical protein